MSDKSLAVLPTTPRGRLASQKTGSTPTRIAPAEFGEHLLRGREQKNRSLQEIADATKISIHQLRALERGDLHRLPAGIYRRAIVRQYAEAVGLDVEETIRELAGVSEEVAGDMPRPEAVVHRRVDAGSPPRTTLMWSSAAPLVVVGVVAAVAIAWNLAGIPGPAAPAPPRAASAPTREPEAPAIALVAAADGVRSSTGNIELAAAPTVSQKQTPTQAQTQIETGSVAAEDATEGELRITSAPEGALITVNGVGWGTTPVTIRYMPFGKKVIRATKPGYVSAQRGVDFAPDRRVRSVRIRLSPESPNALDGR